jgi:hypothetical protein
LLFRSGIDGKNPVLNLFGTRFHGPLFLMARAELGTEWQDL